jgi:predicted site-specific integrase-resolvase
MTRIRRVETLLGPKDAERLTGLSRNTLFRYVRRGVLSHFRTDGGHRRYKLSELLALCGALGRRPAGLIKWKG